MGNRKPRLGEYDTPAKLKALLKKLLDERRLPINIKQGTISRYIIEKEYGFTHHSLNNYYGSEKYEWCKSVVDKFEEQLLKKEGAIVGINLEYGTPKRLKKLFCEIRKSKDIPVNPQGPDAGHINIRGFAEKYNLPYFSLRGRSESWAWARNMLAEFDAELYEKGVIGTVWERRVPEIRKHLEKLKKMRALPVNEYGNLNRMAVMRVFGLPEKQSTYIAEARAPKLKELFTEYDKIIKEDGYSQYSGDAYVEKLKDLLGSEEIVLAKNRRNIARKWIIEKLGLSKGRLRQSPALMELIEQKEKEIEIGLRKGKTKNSFNVYGAASINLGATPYSDKHKRVFPFEELIQPYGLEFAEKVGTVFIAISDDKDSPKNYLSRITHFFGWLADEANGTEDIVNALSNNKAINDKRFARVCMEYQMSILAEPNCKKHPNLSVITGFGKARVFPKYNFRRKARNYKKDSKDSAHRKSILEANRKTVTESVKNILDDAARYRNIDLEDGKDTKAFVATLVDENERRDDLSEDIAEAMLQITVDRLDEIRIQASNVFSEWMQKHEEGKQLIKCATISAEDVVKYMDEFAGSKASGRWQNFVKATFPAKRPDETLCNLLAVIKYKYDGVPPNPNVEGQFWNKQYRKVGGINEVISRLMPTRRAVSAALTLYLCESGVNSEVALVLAPDCISDSDVPAHKQIVSRKDRAQGKAIYDDLSIKPKDAKVVSAIYAIEYLINSVSAINQNIVEQYMAVYAQSGKIKTLTEYNFREDFKKICDGSDYLSNYKFVPSMIRPTVLLEIQLKNPTDLGVAQMFAKHESPTTTVGYTNKLPHRVKQEEHILGYQRLLEFVISQKVENPHVKIGVTEAQWNKMMEHAQRTGMGVFCEDRRVIGKDGKITKCLDVENCVKCKHDRMLVSADIHSIAEMIVWKMALEKQEEKWVSERFERWNEVWVPWQAFFHVVIEEKMTRGRLSKIKKDANALVENIMKQDGFVFPEPW